MPQNRLSPDRDPMLPGKVEPNGQTSRTGALLTHSVAPREVVLRATTAGQKSRATRQSCNLKEGHRRVKREQTPLSAACTLCNGPAMGEQHSQEHIIAAAMGGRRTVSGFICRTCNSNKGSTWDAALAHDLEDLARILNVSRERGPVRPKTVYTSEGLPVRVLPGNRIERAHPTVEESTDGNRTTVYMAASSVEELRNIAETFIGRRNLNQDVDKLVERVSEHSEYLDEALEHRIGTGGDEGEKSLVKSALALLYDAQIDPSVAHIAVNYFADPGGVHCIFPYYKSDIVSPRIPGMPLNCVYVKGEPDTSSLIGYVEIFGFLRRVMWLSRTYDGEGFEHCYAFDPVDGAEQKISVNLTPGLVSEAEDQPDFEAERKGMAEAIDRLLERASEQSNQRELDNLINRALDTWYSEHEKELDAVLTDEECYSISSHIAEAVAPFLLHLKMPLRLPERALREMAGTETREDN